MHFTFDICSTYQTLSKFCEQYGFDITDTYDDMFKTFFNNCSECPNNTYLELVKTFSQINQHYHRAFFKDGVSIGLKDLKIGDEIYVQYLPMSQKYIDYYDEQNICGKVFFIDVDNDDAFLFVDSDSEDVSRKIMSINREYCSYYGDTRGYAIMIYLQDSS